MAEEGKFVELIGGRITFNIIIFVLLLIVFLLYVGYYYYISSVLEMLIRIPSMMNLSKPEEKPFISFSATTTPKVDAKYLATVTLTTVGYGDATPTTVDAQIMMCVLVVLAGGIMTRMLFYTLDMFLDRVIFHYARRNFVLKKLFFDGGIICLLVKMPVAGLFITIPICIGAWVIKAIEKDMDNWFDPYYLSIISSSTVGYGDKVFKTENGRIFAVVWLYVAVYFVDKGLCMFAESFPDGFVRFFTYITRKKADKPVEEVPRRERLFDNESPN